jgi:hypothetical protein
VEFHRHLLWHRGYFALERVLTFRIYHSTLIEPTTELLEGSSRVTDGFGSHNRYVYNNMRILEYWRTVCWHQQRSKCLDGNRRSARLLQIQNA